MDDGSRAAAAPRGDFERRDRVFRRLLEAYARSLTNDATDAAALALDAAIEAVPGATHGSVLIRNERGAYTFAALRGYDAAPLEGVEVPASEVLFGRDWRAGQAFVVRDVAERNAVLAETLPSLKALVEVTRAAAATESLAAPVVHDGDLLAAITVEHMAGEYRFGEEHGALLMLVARSVGALLHRYAAEAQASLMTQAVDASSDGIAIVDVDDGGASARLRHVNRAFADTLGFEQRDAPAWRMAGAFEAEHEVRVREAVASVAMGGERQRFDVRRRDDAAEPRWFEIGVEPVRHDGDGRRVLVSLRDVSERYHLTTELRRLADDLEARLEEAKALEAIDVAITRTVDPQAMLASVLAQVARRPGVGAASLFVRSGVPGDLRLAAADPASRSVGLGARRIGADDPVHVVRRERRRVEHAGDDPQHPLAPSASSYLAWPLEAQDVVVGVLEVLLAPGFEPEPAWHQFMTMVARQLAVAVVHAGMLERLQRSVRSYAALASFNEAIEQADDPDELIELGMQTLMREFAMQRAAYYVVRDDGMIQAVKRWGDMSSEVAAVIETPQPADVGIIGQAATSGEVAYVADYPNWPKADPAAVAAGFVSALAVPVRSAGSVHAVLAIGSAGDRVVLRSDQLAVVRAFARRLEHALERLTYERRIVQTREEAFRSLGLALEFRDYETKGHTDRVVALSRELGRRVGLDEAALEALAWGAYLHDLGKIAISDQILLSPHRLSPAEFEQVKRHAVLGFEMSRDLTFLPHETRLVIRSHHERWDGRGYPDGLAGDAIPYLARLFALVDVYDALTSERPYKHAWRHEEAVTELAEQAGAQFDPELTTAMLELLAEGGPRGGGSR